MKWLELQIKTTAENEDVVSGILYNHGATGLAIEDPNDIIEFSKTEGDWDFIDSDLVDIDTDKDEIKIKAYYTIDKSIDSIVNDIRYEIEEKPVDEGKESLGKIETFEVDDEDWSENWKQYFETIVINDNIIIKPSWEEYEKRDGDIVIELDPGMAFGTGSHETTMMCSEALDKYVKEDSTVFDVGCGSGILSIVAAKLGAKKVTAVDLDKMSVKISKENVINNKVSHIVDVKQSNLLAQVEGKASIIVANIVAEILVEMMKNIHEYLEEDGVFIGSGIITSKVDIVKEALGEYGFNIVDEKENSGWVCIVAIK